ncbi:chemotaxis-specific protein-glutamate methyltransferase CheB [Zavarzinella formosa]|uniref:chemotaxis-specific protein-glutamate methyltransferase CheB n=1 Tax=Zavarzinella formosa TaxID=360055 RepID=UPI00037E59AC|nr:chemotaxis-specific protein-glutamate methyltransferase CheB [Zavarzinella formosa]
MRKTRVLVVEDSLTVRKYLVECFQADPEFEVVAEADDGKKAIELCERLRPDVVTIDMVLPVMSGLSATEYIMAYCPTPIVIVSASTNRGELFRTYEALAAGAIEVIEKPLDDTSNPEWERKLLSTVKLVSRIKVITHLRAKLGQTRKDPPVASSLPSRQGPVSSCQYLAIGASTGGPQALATLLRALPADYPLPILIVMHISPIFGVAFADWLNDHSSIPVVMVVRDQPLPSFGTPCVLLAPPDRHLIVRERKLMLTYDREIHSCRPSVDVLFQSIAEEIGKLAAAVLLTGMGRDGAKGLLAIREAGGLTIAQDEATSVVFGMPREAILLGAARHVLPLEEIATTIASLAVAGNGGKKS